MYQLPGGPLRPDRRVEHLIAEDVLWHTAAALRAGDQLVLARIAVGAYLFAIVTVIVVGATTDVPWWLTVPSNGLLGALLALAGGEASHQRWMRDYHRDKAESDSALLTL